MQPSNILNIHDFSHRSQQAIALEAELVKLELATKIIISCGLNTVEKAVSEKGEGSFLLSIGDPKKHYDNFDCLVIPSHEPLPQHQNIIITDGLMNDVHSRLNEREGSPSSQAIAVLLGGKHVGGDVTAEDASVIAKLLNQHARSAIVTTSKRTEDGVLQALTSALEIPYEAYDFQKDGQVLNPYLTMLGKAAAIIATADSLRMASEACSTGKAVYLHKPEKLHFSYANFAESLIEKGFANCSSDFSGNLQQTKRLNEAERVAKMVAQLVREAL